jgi:hypothetical protein
MSGRRGDAGPPVLPVHGIPTDHRLREDVVPVVAQRPDVVAELVPRLVDRAAW